MTPPDDEARQGGQRATQAAKAALAKKAAPSSGGTAVATQPAGGVRHYTSIMEAFEDPKQKDQIALALPRAMDIDRFARICVTVVRNNPTLGQCTVVSLLGACMQAAQLGLEPGVLGQSYLVPFYNTKERAHDVQFIIGYQGYIELFYRSGKVHDVVAREVCENDEWDFAYGITDTMRHVPAREERGRPILYYGLAHIVGGGHVLHVMNLEEIADRRERSRAKDSGPWQTDEIPMSKKTVIRAMSPYIPKSTDVARALAADETIAHNIMPDMATEVAAQPIDVDEAPPEDGGDGADGDPGPAEPPK